MDINKSKEKLNKKMKLVKAGQVWSVNDKRTAGHNSQIGKKYKNGIMIHVPTTHAPKTNKQNNIKLRKNFSVEDDQESYILSHALKSQVSKAGVQRKNMKVRDAVDKSIIRHLVKVSKKKK